MESALYASHCKSLHEIPLEEGVGKENWKNDHNGTGHPQILIRQGTEQGNSVRCTCNGSILLEKIDGILQFIAGSAKESVWDPDIEHADNQSFHLATMEKRLLWQYRLKQRQHFLHKCESARLRRYGPLQKSVGYGGADKVRRIIV